MRSEGARRIAAFVALTLFVLGLLAFFAFLDRAVGDSSFVLLVVDGQDRPLSEVVEPTAAYVEGLALPIEIKQVVLPEELWDRGDVVLKGEHSAEMRSFLRSKDADLALILGEMRQDACLGYVQFKLVWFPKEENFPEFPGTVEELPLLIDAKYISPLLGIRVSQAIANAQLPDPQNALRRMALQAYAESIEALDPCAPIAGASTQVVILGLLVAPDQEGCESEFAWSAMYAQATILSESVHALNLAETVSLNEELMDTLYVLGSRESDSRLFDKAI